VGESTITAVARDAVGGEGTDSVEVTLILGPGPAVTIRSPRDGFVTGGPADRAEQPLPRDRRLLDP
jgi:hypothetical protein